MTIKLYTFRFSPPARLAHLVAKIIEVDHHQVEVDLSKGENHSSWFYAINPKHQVPALDANGVYMAESRDIVRHLMDKYNVDPAKEHWYPKDPKQREEVDKWMEWSKELHLNLEKAVVVSYIGPQMGLPFRENYGLAICFLGALCRRDKQAMVDLKKNLQVADEMVAERKITCMEDLNLGDLTTFMEVSLPIECHEDFSWDQFPNLSHLYEMCKKIPSFDEVHKPFMEFVEMYRFHRDRDTRASWYDIVTQALTTVGMAVRIIKLNLFG